MTRRGARRHRIGKGAALAGAATLALLAGPAAADETPWVAPLKFEIADGWTALLHGDANLSGFHADQPGDSGGWGTTASLFAEPRVEKLFANGWRFGFRSELNLYHDRLSGDNYGNGFFTKAYFFLHTPYGRVELGQQDGAAYSMAVTGPLVAGQVAIDDANTVFFRDPATGGALTDSFNVRTAVFATSNAAKISYYSPRLIGVQIGVSYTPELTRGVIPFAQNAPHAPDRQDDVIEAAINYTGYFGATALGAYAGLAAGHNAQRTSGHDDLFDWAIGAELDQDLGGTTLAVGGAYREANSFTFDPAQSFKTGTTHAVHASTTLTHGPWSAGFEYSDGEADAEGALPALGIEGYEISAAYSFNPDLQLTGGWQHLHFTRSSGAFYDGSTALDADAAFLYLHVHV